MKAAKSPKSNQNKVNTETGLGRTLPRLILVVSVFLRVFVVFIFYLADESVSAELGYGVDAS